MKRSLHHAGAHVSIVTTSEGKDPFQVEVIRHAVWLADLEQRNGHTLGTFFASEQREFNRRVRNLRDLQGRTPTTDTPQSAMLRLLSLGA
jgi:hypothetical protein